MRALHLDDKFSPCGYDIKYKKFRFPGGESHIKIDVHFEDDVLITQSIRCADDIMEICISVDALRREGIRNIDLFIPYVPYARQDRVMTRGEPLSVKVFAGIINSLGLRHVYVFDPHSDVCGAVINNCIIVDNHNFAEWSIKRLFHHSKKFCLVSPDAGSDKKIKELSRRITELGYDFRVIKCDKTRDARTGNISGFEVYADNLGKLPCLIVDDICDGGGTFLGLAQKLEQKNAGDLYLAISHGIFSNGTDELEKNSSAFLPPIRAIIKAQIL